MLGVYLNSTAQLVKRTGANEYAEPVYAAPVSIKCRIERKQRLIRKADGEEAVSDTTVYTDAEVDAGDMLDGRTVAAVEDMAGLDGRAIGKRVYL